MESLRNKFRQVHKDCRQEFRRNALNSKRLHLKDIGEIKYLDETEVKSLAELIKSTKDVTVLKKLNVAFSQGNNLQNVFLRTSGALQGLIGLLTCRDITLQLESAACIINLLTASDHKSISNVAKLTASYFMLYLQSSEAELQELSAWALGNIAADCQKCCSFLKTHRFCQSIFNLLERSQSPGTIYSALFALKCYMNFQHDEWSDILSMGLANRLPVLLQFSGSENILVQAANIMFFLSTRSEYNDYLEKSNCVAISLNNINQIILSTVKEDRIVMDQTQCQLSTYLIRSLAEVAENSETANKILSITDVSTLSMLLTCHYPHIHKETLWLLSNLASHHIFPKINCLWHNTALLTRVTDKLMSTDRIVEEVLIFINNLLAVHGWHPSLPFISSYINEATLLRLLGSTNTVTVELTLKLLSLICEKNQSMNHNYSDHLLNINMTG